MFRSSEGTVGVEYELQLVHADTMDLVDGILPLLEHVPRTPHIKPELTQCTVEITTPPCGGIGEVARDLKGRLWDVRRACDRLRLRLSGGGTHAFCRRLGTITPLPRYQALPARIGILGGTTITFALHVHVGMVSADEMVTAMQDLRGYLPVLLALSASSPFWHGYDTGHAAWRQRVLATGRNYGLPPRFADWRDVEGFFEAASGAAILQSWRDVHWDIRPRPDFGTVEIRIMDSPATLTEAMALAAFVRALTIYLIRTPAHRRSPVLPRALPDWLERENHFQASRAALDATYASGGHPAVRPLREVVDAAIGAVWSIADELGDGTYLEAVSERLARYPSYVRQRDAYRPTGSPRDVVVALTEELEADLGPPVMVTEASDASIAEIVR